ncbi:MULTISPECIES: hypothetical protein [unclassified Paenibacillus]|nr:MULTISPECIES: hypothetical protein [unclassified Paenibacillus]MDF9844540.1 hypothetical protein [Paenibacillus sp. PastF-2]MDF9851175.1 hypothetical protein [Paenibacillus sp. PastM-2]MDF9856190.1 hypothetical protein [Paenibacillus sp. PastF-1]MDH6481581.1 hypothetical protein [Paenibacillus sp. PastH-2]
MKTRLLSENSEATANMSMCCGSPYGAAFRGSAVRIDEGMVPTIY